MLKFTLKYLARFTFGVGLYLADMASDLHLMVSLFETDTEQTVTWAYMTAAFFGLQFFAAWLGVLLYFFNSHGVFKPKDEPDVHGSQEDIPLSEAFAGGVFFKDVYEEEEKENYGDKYMVTVLIDPEGDENDKANWKVAEKDRFTLEKVVRFLLQYFEPSSIYGLRRKLAHIFCEMCGVSTFREEELPTITGVQVHDAFLVLCLYLAGLPVVAVPLASVLSTATSSGTAFFWLLPGSLLGLWTMCFAFLHPFWFTLSIGPLLELHLAFWASPAASLKLPVYGGVWCAALVFSAFYFFAIKIFNTGENRYGNDLYVTLSEYTKVGLFHENVYEDE